MKAVRTSAVALIAVATLGLAAPVVSASTHPNPVIPGRSVSISDDKRCGAGHQAKATSDLFGDVPLAPGGDHMGAEARIGTSAATGTYRVTIECGPGGDRFTETLAVRGADPSADARTGLGGGVGEVSVAQAAGGVALLILAGGASYLMHRHAGRRP
ncbi:hypothetical protein [Streptomyces sp. MST-110588]|uniref:hypothetical protein n=1 Tax=Streptomyces sp. MST-110588 TaxID=2833628 RepID=UPI001F5D752A|nr:hypothetical protein [Streptomyces sp. MST-110588]UNO39124.1 hypothetical protein KGS77_05125 [Streptomyces sp. MST-110588]